MGSTAEVDWKDNARLLRAQGKSEREIAMAVAKSPSSVHEAVKDVVPRDGETNGNGHVELDAAQLAAIAGDSSGGPTPGQLDIDGGEAPQTPQHVEEIRV